jgi:hypothetical protein
MIDNTPLTYAASRLLLRLLFISGENESREELMRTAHIPTRSNFFAAKRELRQRGYLNDDGSLEFAGQHIDEDSPLVLVAPSVKQPSIVLLGETPRQQAVQLDNLPDDGDRMRPTSNFQKRRKAQIAFVQRVWLESFGEPVSVAETKILLNLTDNYAEAPGRNRWSSPRGCSETTKRHSKKAAYRRAGVTRYDHWT